MLNDERHAAVCVRSANGEAREPNHQEMRSLGRLRFSGWTCEISIHALHEIGWNEVIKLTTPKLSHGGGLDGAVYWCAVEHGIKGDCGQGIQVFTTSEGAQSLSSAYRPQLKNRAVRTLIHRRRHHKRAAAQKAALTHWNSSSRSWNKFITPHAKHIIPRFVTEHDFADLLKPVPHWCALAQSALPFQSVPNELLNWDEDAITAITIMLTEAQRQLSEMQPEVVMLNMRKFAKVPVELVQEIGSYVPRTAIDVRVVLSNMHGDDDDSDSL